MESKLLALGILGVQALIWIPIVVWLERRGRWATAATRERVEHSGEPMLIEAQTVEYCHLGLQKIGIQRTRASVAITRQRVIVTPHFGSGDDIPLKEIAEVKGNKWFRSFYRNGQTFVILKLRDGREVGFLTRDAQRWIRTLRERAAPAELTAAEAPPGVGTELEAAMPPQGRGTELETAEGEAAARARQSERMAPPDESRAR